MDKEIPLLSKLLPKLDLTDFGKMHKDMYGRLGLTGFGKTVSKSKERGHHTGFGKITMYKIITNNLNKSDENYNICEDFANSNTQKLYKRMGNNQLKRARSVVRISRRSSEPQTVGSKPIGPVNHMGSNNSVYIIREEGNMDWQTNYEKHKTHFTESNKIF